MSLVAPLAPSASSQTSSAPPPYEAAPILLSLATLALGAFAPAVLGDGDTWSHVATGEWILDHRAIPHSDPFTFTFAGMPWTAHEWLSEVLLALAYRAAGWGGVTLLTGAAAALAVYIVARRAARDLGGIALVVVLMLSLALIAPGLLARPHVLALPVLAFWCDALIAARERDAAPPAILAVLMALWANLHGGFIFGLALIVPFAIEAVWTAAHRGEAARAWLLFGLASLVAALVSPLGGEGLIFPFKLMNNPELANISEWRAQDFSHPGAYEVGLVALIALALARPLRLAPMRLLLLLGLVHMSLQHSRHEMLLAIVAPMLLAGPIAKALDQNTASHKPARALVFAALAGALILAGVRLALPFARIDSPNSPISALQAAPEALRSKPVLNAYEFGGFFIYSGVKPFIDGRADMFGGEFMGLYKRILAGETEPLETTLKRYEIAWTIFSPGQAVVAVMDREPGWRRLYADKFAVVHVRTDSDLPGGSADLRGD